MSSDAREAIWINAFWSQDAPTSFMPGSGNIVDIRRLAEKEPYHKEPRPSAKARLAMVLRALGMSDLISEVLTFSLVLWFHETSGQSDGWMDLGQVLVISLVTWVCQRRGLSIEEEHGCCKAPCGAVDLFFYIICLSPAGLR